MNIPTVKEIGEKSRTQRWGYEFFLDHLADYIAKLALILRITPLQLTLFWVIAQFFIPFLFLTGKYSYFVLAIFLFQLMFIVDLSDGKLFRFQSSVKKTRKPLFPKYVDRLGHFINDAVLFFFLGLGTSFRFGEIIYFYLGLIVVFLFVLNKAITVNPAWYKAAEEQAVVAHIFKCTIPRSGKSKLKQILFDFIRPEHLGNLLFWGIILDLPHYILVVYLMFFFLEFWRKFFVQAIFLIREDRQRQ